MEIDIILLGILSGGDFFGYELMKIIRAVMSDIAEVTTGTLYYKLKGLEKKGFLSSSSEQEGLRPRRLRYSITAEGKEEFLRLAMVNITAGGRPYWPYLSSLFFVQYLPEEEVLRAVKGRIAFLEKVLARVRAAKKVMKAQNYPFHALLLADHGLSHLEVDISWLRTFARTLKKNAASLADHEYSREAWERHMESVPVSEGPGK